MDIMKKLKTETTPDHKRLESYPYFKALAEHKLPLECYVNQLKGLAVIHGVLERALAEADCEQVAAVWNESLRKLPLLAEDLEFFKPRIEPDYMPAIEAALAMTEKIRIRSIENPLTLLGYLYVFEGSTLGNRMHQPDITATFHLEGLPGSRYYASYGEQVSEKWRQFRETMAAALQDADLHDPIIAAAHEAFSGLEKLYSALFPMEKQKKSFHVTRINPEAGNHPIPEDEREITAALTASNRAWAMFPYYQARYGERGKRFSDSDTSWLVTLTHLNLESIEQQMNWLVRLLATRGMPSIMLERTIQLLHEELIKEAPENKPTYDRLLEAADMLAEKRRQSISDKEFAILSREFDDMAEIKLAEQYKNTGSLIVSAVADEHSGIAGAVDAICDWLTDPGRFSEEWVVAVNQVIEKAKKRTVS
ncbi:MAG: biliverdin-producing heme oxygenase [Desulfobacterales bacterium]|nr:biliverdin-producing heme oxygenase [Desulfobacterales bacterium]